MVGRNGSGETALQARDYCAQKEFDMSLWHIGEEVRHQTLEWPRHTALRLRNMPAALRSKLQAPRAAVSEEYSIDSGSDADDGFQSPAACEKGKLSAAEEVRAHTLQVNKMRKGCRMLMKAKKSDAEDRASLKEDLDLLCGSGELGKDLPQAKAHWNTWSLNSASW
jgi:hypothetical protein